MYIHKFKQAYLMTQPRELLEWPNINSFVFAKFIHFYYLFRQ